MLELVERLADLHMKRARISDLADKAQSLIPARPEIRQKLKIYMRAGRVLLQEIRRLETLIEETPDTEEALNGTD